MLPRSYVTHLVYTLQTFYVEKERGREGGGGGRGRGRGGGRGVREPISFER